MEKQHKEKHNKSVFSEWLCCLYKTLILMSSEFSTLFIYAVPMTGLSLLLRIPFLCIWDDTIYACHQSFRVLPASTKAEVGGRYHIQKKVTEMPHCLTAPIILAVKPVNGLHHTFMLVPEFPHDNVRGMAALFPTGIKLPGWMGSSFSNNLKKRLWLIGKGPDPFCQSPVPWMLLWHVCIAANSQPGLMECWESQGGGGSGEVNP